MEFWIDTHKTLMALHTLFYFPNNNSLVLQISSYEDDSSEAKDNPILEYLLEFW